MTIDAEELKETIEQMINDRTRIVAGKPGSDVTMWMLTGEIVGLQKLLIELGLVEGE